MSNILYLNKELYKKNTLERAAIDYASLASVVINDSDRYWELVFSDCLVSSKRTMNEFENYVIDLSVQEGV